MSLVTLFGDKLQSKTGEVSTADALKGKKAIAVYFSAHWCPPCRGFTPKLAEWYEKDLKAKGLEVVFASSDQDEAAFKDYFKDMPWLAIPYANRSVKEELSKKYKVNGIPSLVILDAEGNVITKDGRSAVSSDPTGLELPWAPKPLQELIGTEFLTKDGVKPKADVIDGKVTALYFSAHWCPPCRGFTPKFAEVYKKLKADNKSFEVVFCSSDRDEASFKEYFNEMPWAALPFSDRKRKEELARHFDCNGIPMLVILDEDLNVINKNAVGKVRSDEAGASFPWAPELINDVNEDCDGIDEAPSVVVLQENVAADVQAENKKALQPEAEKALATAKKTGEDPEFNFFFADKTGQISGRVRDECGCDKWEEAKTAGFKVVLLDISDSGAYYRFEGEKFDAAALGKFLADYKEKKLTRRQMGA